MILPPLTVPRIFLLDGLGALLTTALNVLLLPHIPQHIPFLPPFLAALTVASACLALYSLSCALSRRSWRFLPPIILGNALYCGATAAAVVAWSPQFSAWGLGYIAGEIAIVGAVVGLESAAFRVRGGTSG